MFLILFDPHHSSEVVNVSITLSFYLFISFLVTLGLCCWAWAFSGCREGGGYSSCVTWASHCGACSCEHRLQGAWAQQLWPMGSRARTQELYLGSSALYTIWGLPKPGVQPLSPALASRFLTTGLQGSPAILFK